MYNNLEKNHILTLLPLLEVIWVDFSFNYQLLLKNQLYQKFLIWKRDQEFSGALNKVKLLTLEINREVCSEVII